MEKHLKLLGLFLLLFHHCLVAKPAIPVADSVDLYPTHWWVGMKNPHLQLMVHAKNIGRDIKVDALPKEGLQLAAGIVLVKVNRVENSNYLFLDLQIARDARPGKRMLSFGAASNRRIEFELKARRPGNGRDYARGITSADLIYLIVPDRFSNGDVSNDRFSDMNDTNCDRNNPFFRHGGDLEGITRHLDYVNDLGATTLWLTPVIENDQGLTNEGGTLRSAYHGYAFTDQYKVDRRLGGNEAYRKFVQAAHAKGLKVIQDAVYNHVGDRHFLFLDPPSKDFFNQWPSYTNTSFLDQPLIDPYASKSDYDRSVNGWFTHFMPDLNQRNPFVANFLIQYAIWAVEEFGIDGWRVDTYFYSDKEFLNHINQSLYDEFPSITVFGETTMHSVTEQAYYCQNNLNTKWKSNLQGVIDFQWEGSALASLSEAFGWDNGIMHIYNILVQDLLYKDPRRNQILLDNHDQDRFFSVIGEDFDKYKMGIVLLFTQRGIPQLYYGTEILMKNFKNPSDAEVRKDFPGGWKGDSVNKFLPAGRTKRENEAFDFVQKLARFRKSAPAVGSGKTMQFVPQKGVYVYFRYNEKQTIMVALNTDTANALVATDRFREITKGFRQMKNVLSDQVADFHDFMLAPKESAVYELTK